MNFLTLKKHCENLDSSNENLRQKSSSFLNILKKFSPEYEAELQRKMAELMKKPSELPLNQREASRDEKKLPELVQKQFMEEAEKPEKSDDEDEDMNKACIDYAKAMIEVHRNFESHIAEARTKIDKTKKLFVDAKSPVDVEDQKKGMSVAEQEHLKSVRQFQTQLSEELSEILLEHENNIQKLKETLAPGN
ncbi:hypothetical protein QR680_016905 [Steinernema hermaphroditum]|uniref:Uncharacterized protein n=1 Tax=Steinernema hermaphroditum TaxID=289476 RepID=A0AA39HEP2_9BILA|nr:hypothetical protein QR680_016905 [Steinernema hermaphroditum]